MKKKRSKKVKEKDVEVLEKVESVENEAETRDEKVEVENNEVEELDENALLTLEVNKARLEAEEFKDKYLRLMAEFDNFRKRTRREMETLREYASEKVIQSLLTVKDDFDRTLTTMDKTDNLASLKEGVVMVNEKFNRTLEKEGLAEIPAVGELFDSEVHEAIHSLPIEDEEKKGKVLEQVEKGYRLKDRVIRYSKVVVGE